MPLSLTAAATWPVYVDTHVTGDWEIRCGECSGPLAISGIVGPGYRLTAVRLVHLIDNHVHDAHRERV